MSAPVARYDIADFYEQRSGQTVRDVLTRRSGKAWSWSTGVEDIGA